MILEVEAAHLKAALEGNVTAQIHILQTKGGWRNPNRVRKVVAERVMPPQPEIRFAFEREESKA